MIWPRCRQLLQAVACILSLQFLCVDSVLQTLELSVTLSDAPVETSTYTELISQAFFGPIPSMIQEDNPTLVMANSPEENSLLCDNTTESAKSSLPPNTMLLVPRGSCTFERKALNAQLLGAKGMLVYGNLASRYNLNETAHANQTNYEYQFSDIVFPAKSFDYDCSYGRALIPKIELSFDPLPYNAEQNDPLLSGPSSSNLCLMNSADKLASCASKSCLLTGSNQSDDNVIEACCAWDLSVWLYEDKSLPRTPETQVHIPSGYLTMEQASRLMADMRRNEKVEVVLTRRWRPQYNVSSLLIWALGVAVAALAAYLTAGEYHELTNSVMKQQVQQDDSKGGSRPSHTERTDPPMNSASGPPMEEVLELTAAHACGFIVMASTSLLVLFYFKVYNVVKVFYAFGCSTAVSQVLAYPFITAIMNSIKSRDVVIWATDTEDFGDITLRDILSHAVGYSLGIVWLSLAFFVHDPDNLVFFWVTQDIFGACICITFLKVIRLNSIRVASILLFVAFLYDIFFVFVTPLLFKGESVMITVATSGGPPKADASWCEKYPNDADCQGGNPLPMLLTIPRVFDYQGGSSLLGLGDIVLPGLLLSFGARFDAAKSLLGVMGGGSGSLSAYGCPEQRYLSHHCPRCWILSLCSGGYFVPLVIAYGVGLLMANMAVYWMKMGQPALLYLVPCCLGTMAFMGWRRNELQDLWDGPRVLKAADRILYGEETDELEAEVEGALQDGDHHPLPVDEGSSMDPLTVPSAKDDSGG